MTALLEKTLELEEYLVMPEAEMHERIESARRELGKRVVILGHH